MDRDVGGVRDKERGEGKRHKGRYSQDVWQMEGTQ